MVENPILRVRRLALAAQVAAGGPARTGQMIRAGLLVPASDLPPPPPRSISSAAAIETRSISSAASAAPPPRRDSAAIEPRSISSAASPGPLVAAFAAATGREPPPEAWFRARGVRRITDQMQTRAAQRFAAASRPLRVTQGND